jgi:hypothetical protein
MRQVGNMLLVGGLTLMSAGMAVAQAPPGPLQPVPSTDSSAPPARPVKKGEPRKSIMGDWKFNRDDSDDPRSKLHQATAHPSNPNTGMSGPRMGWPGGGMGGPGYGGNRGGQNPQNTSSQTNEKLQALVDPSMRLHLQQMTDKNPEVELTGDQGKKTIFYTDGKLPDKPSDPNMQQVSAHWDGNKLVTEEKFDKNGTMTRTYSLAEGGTQLLEEVHLVTGKKNDSPVTIHYAYDAVDPGDSRY